MFKQHMFSNIVLIVGPLCPASLKCIVFSKALLQTSAVCSDWLTDTVHCDGPKPQACVV